MSNIKVIFQKLPASELDFQEIDQNIFDITSSPTTKIPSIKRAFFYFQILQFRINKFFDCDRLFTTKLMNI